MALPPCHVSLISSHTHLLFSVSLVLIVFFIISSIFSPGFDDSDFLFHTPPSMVLAWSGGATERLCRKTLSYLSTVVSSFEVTKGAKLLLFATGGPGSWTVKLGRASSYCKIPEASSLSNFAIITGTCKKDMRPMCRT